MVRIIEIFLSLKRLLSIHSQISFVTVATTFMIYDLRILRSNIWTQNNNKQTNLFSQISNSTPGLRKLRSN